MENIQPLKKELYNRAKALGITNIILNFSGGNDEGYLNITLLPWDQNKRDDYAKLNADIEDWTWEVYSYSGAGDGGEYGDDIEYDLEKNMASCSEWYTARTEGETERIPLTFEKDEEFNEVIDE